ncbi:lipase [Actinomadura viridis]|uniref:Dienelactone hydrolase n=1 Tax=Actinomadura viridis TaxID=58110 RepID=A0A931DGZ2_9ACTN|nr:lipase [Actinomadura viridis]MBG6090959.1 dienelactone hydrolase [Actinomadura viridis]
MAAARRLRRDLRLPSGTPLIGTPLIGTALACVTLAGCTGPATGPAAGATAKSTGPAARARAVSDLQEARGRLPRPTGAFRVGTTAFHLVDRARRDPWAPERARELMISVWYPAVPGGGGGTGAAVPHMTAKAAAHFGSAEGAATTNLGMPPGKADWAATRTHARAGAPVDRRAGRLPVVLYSSGLADPRTFNTTLVEDLASRGYAVVTIDHTHEASEVEFPGGRLATGRLLEGGPPSTPGEVTALLKKVMAARVADTRFVLDRLPGLGRGRPGGLGAALDTRRVGMAGHSAGGFTAAQAMHDDRRIRAGVNMDGQMDYAGEPNGSQLSPVARNGLDRPLMLLGSAPEGDYRGRPSWAAFWRNTRGWKFNGTLRGSRHASYTDAPALLPGMARGGAIPKGGLAGVIGTIPPERAIAAERAYVASFFDRWLRGRDDRLLDGPSARFPEMDVAR